MPLCINVFNPILYLASNYDCLRQNLESALFVYYSSSLLLKTLIKEHTLSKRIREMCATQWTEEHLYTERGNQLLQN